MFGSVLSDKAMGCRNKLSSSTRRLKYKIGVSDNLERGAVSISGSSDSGIMTQLFYPGPTKDHPVWERGFSELNVCD